VNVTPKKRPARVSIPGAKSRSWFARFARQTSRWTGRPSAFFFALFIVIVWIATGPIFRYSDTWQLVINTATTVVTFLMVFLIHNAQYRDSEAVQMKLDELLRVTQGAHNALLDLEELEQDELDDMREAYCELAENAREKLRSGGVDTDAPEIRRK
jgi:low affinity Fe/Cu permease